MANTSLTKAYAKWDHIEDSDSDDDSTKKPTIFSTEPQNFKVKDVDYTTPQLREKLKRIPREEKEIWQVVIRKLRVWAASSKGAPEGSNAIPCRPYCILVNNLYPLGQVITRHLCEPPEDYPSAEAVLEQLTSAMVSPPSSFPQHRPGKVCFVDENLAAELSKSLGKVGIEVSQLSEADGVEGYVREFSNFLVRKDIARRAELSDDKGYLSVEGVSVPLLRTFFNAAAKYRVFKPSPWRKMVERQVIEIIAESDLEITDEASGKVTTVPAGHCYVSVLNGSQDDGAVMVKSTIHCGTLDERTVEYINMPCIGIFYTLMDAERRLLPANTTSARLQLPHLQRCEQSGKCSRDIGGERLKKCTRCKATFYASQEEQKKHWPQHRRFCRPSTPTSGSQYWGYEESVLMFEKDVAIPFDDHDAIDKHKLPLAEGLGPTDLRIPLALRYVNGKPERARAIDIVWCERVTRVLTEIIANHFAYLKESLPAVCGEDYPCLECDMPCPGGGKSKSGSDSGQEKLKIQNATILTMAEYDKISAYMQKKIGESGLNGTGAKA